MKISVEKIKRVLAVVIAIGFWLPLAQCTLKPQVHAAPNPTTTATANHNVSVASEPIIADVFIPAEQVRASLTKHAWDSLPLVLIFTWPLFACVLRWYARRRSTLSVANLIELVLATVSLAFLGFIVAIVGGLRAYGVLMFTAFGLHLLLSAYVLLVYARRQKSKLR